MLVSWSLAHELCESNLQFLFLQNYYSPRISLIVSRFFFGVDADVLKRSCEIV